jgi:hypothetical protein
MAWLISKYIGRLQCEGQKPIPVWTAYTSISLEDNTKLDNAYSLPIINAPAHDWTTLLTVLENLSKLNEICCGVNSKVLVTFDMDLYKRALKIEHVDPKYKGKWWLLPGAFHTSLCAVRCLGKTVAQSGLDAAWSAAGLYSDVVVNQIIDGGHYSRAVEAHEVTLKA